ncbi:MAG: cell division protein FtsZ [Elusimicrobia bacterium]|nr:cell division protein FtsZ [Elusimicrobiota bacterium]
MKMKIIDDPQTSPANIKVIGVGGGGGNAVNLMVISNLKGVQFISANTDADALKKSLAEHKIQLGPKLTKGQGSGARPEIGKQATEESISSIAQILEGTDMLFITAGMGGGTGTGGAPVIAKIAKSANILTVGVVTKPFMWEGKVKMAIAEEGIKELKAYTDALIEIPNQRLFSIIDDDTLATQTFEKANEVLKKAVQSISDIITSHGMINVDFQDVKTIMLSAGDAMLGFGEASGDDRATVATKMAISSPLLEDVSIDGAKGVLVNITGNSKDLKMSEIDTAMSIIHSAASPDAHLIYGQAFDDELNDNLKITVIATGFSGERKLSKQKKIIFNEERKKEDVLNKENLDIPAYKRIKVRKLK